MSDMTRRSFLRGLAGVLAVAAAPQILIPKHGTSFATHRKVEEAMRFHFKGSRYPAYFSRIITVDRDLTSLRDYDYANPTQIIVPEEKKIIAPRKISISSPSENILHMPEEVLFQHLLEQFLTL